MDVSTDLHTYIFTMQFYKDLILVAREKQSSSQQRTVFKDFFFRHKNYTRTHTSLRVYVVMQVVPRTMIFLPFS